MIFLYLLLAFFKIGIFGFGGGYAMLPLIQNEVVEKYQWISSSEFTDIIAISQMTPGPIGINSATYVGYMSVLNAGYGENMAVLGSCVATFAVVFPSFVIMILLSKAFLKYKDHPIMLSVFKGLRPAVIGMLGSAALMLMTTENFGSPKTDTRQFVISVALCVVTFFATHRDRIHPILMILICGLIGLIVYR